MLSLNGNWKAKPDNNNIGETEAYFEFDYDDSNWKSIKIPGHWQEEGFPNHQGILWYRYKFVIPDEMKQFLKIIRLQFKGVFYYCKVWLNEEYIGDHEGYFDKFDFNVTGLLDKENLICVKVICNEENDRSNKRQITGVFSDWDSSDPLFNPGGIWNDVALVETGLTYIKYLEIKSEIIDENSARLYLRVEIITEKIGEKKFQLTIQPKNFTGTVFKEEFYKKVNESETEFEREIVIEDAHFWWTHDHGYPYLYLLEIAVFDGDKVSDEKKQIFGIREFTRVIKGRSWEFYLNRTRIYIRGGNYAPSNHRIAYVTREDIERNIDLAVEANFNMIRVHAHVDSIKLHEVCAEKGILIWQDFALQWGYNMAIKETAKAQIKQMARKIQNYPSQAIYCCHNEPFKGMSLKSVIFMVICLGLCIGLVWSLQSWLGSNWRFSNTVFWGLFILFSFIFDFLPTMFFYNRNKNILDKHLFKAVLEVDDSLPIVQNSGSMGLIRLGTDLHTYEGWYIGKNYRDAYCYTKFPLKHMICFITEYGAQAFPAFENLKKVIREEDLWPINWKLLKTKYRCQSMFFAKWFNFGNYSHITEFIEATQEYQAELLKFYNELWRINRYNPNGGTIMFQFNDCFPGITWSIVDYWGTPKKGYYSTQLSFEPVYIMANWPKECYKPNKVFKTKIYVVNDLHYIISDVTVHWEILNNQKQMVLSGDYTCNLEEDSIKILDEIQYKIPIDAQGLYELVLTLKFEETTINNFYKIKIK
ncbi:MAG: glycoside hydrolase family 2 protein [Promethearchaeota archaeon]